MLPPVLETGIFHMTVTTVLNEKNQGKPAVFSKTFETAVRLVKYWLTGLLLTGFYRTPAFKSFELPALYYELYRYESTQKM